jgi:hypothetical protein
MERNDEHERIGRMKRRKGGRAATLPPQKTELTSKKEK